MKLKYLAILISLFFLSGAWINHTGKKKKILVYTKNGKGYVHKNLKNSAEALMKIGDELNVSVDTTSDPSVFTEENLVQYNAIIFSNTNNDVFDNDQQRLVFKRYIQAGGGWVGIHSAIGTERSWQWFIKMMGGTFLRHPPYQKYRLEKLDKNHPSLKNFPDEWEKEDECYYFKRLNPDIHVLMVADLTTVNDSLAPNIFGDKYPAVWCHEFDGGRQWYTALGHDPADYSDPLYVNHLKGGIKWVLSRKTKINFSKATAKSI